MGDANPDDEAREFRAVASGGMGIAVMVLGCAFGVGGSLEQTSARFGWLALALWFVVGGFREYRRAGTVDYIVVCTPKEVRWGPTGSERAVLLSEVERIDYRPGNLADGALVFRTKDGVGHKLDTAKFRQPEALMRHLRPRFRGSMTWLGKPYNPPNPV